MKKKIFGMVVVFVGLCAFMIPSLSAWTFSDWNTTYGSATKVDENITNIKGNLTAEEGMFKGPYSKVSTQKLDDGIKEEVNLELKKENFKQSELFELTTSLDDSTKNYITETVVFTQKDGDKFVVKFPLDPTFSATIDKDGVYTYRYEMYKKENKVLSKFTILLWDEVIATSKEVELTDANGKDNVTVRSVWFCNVQVEKGVNVYTELPPKPIVEEPNKDPEQTTITKPDNTINNNPKTHDNLLTYIIIALASCSTLIIATKKVLKKIN